MKMLENSQLYIIELQPHVLPMQLHPRHTEPTFMKAQKCPIYLDIHTYTTFQSALLPTPKLTLLFTAALYMLYYICIYSSDVMAQDLVFRTLSSKFKLLYLWVVAPPSTQVWLCHWCICVSMHMYDCICDTVCTYGVRACVCFHVFFFACLISHS